MSWHEVSGEEICIDVTLRKSSKFLFKLAKGPKNVKFQRCNLGGLVFFLIVKSKDNVFYVFSYVKNDVNDLYRCLFSSKLKCLLHCLVSFFSLILLLGCKGFNHLLISLFISSLTNCYCAKLCSTFLFFNTWLAHRT